LSSVPEGEKPKKTQFEITNSLAQWLYKAETAEVKQKVNEHCKKMRVKEETPSLTKKNRFFQESVFSNIFRVNRGQTYIFFGLKFNR